MEAHGHGYWLLGRPGRSPLGVSGVSGCSCGAGQGTTISQSGDIGPKDNATEVSCACTLTLVDSCDCRVCIGTDRQLPIDNPIGPYTFCLPPELNMGQDAGAAALPQSDWETAVDNYCTQTVADTITKLYAFISKTQCEDHCEQKIVCVHTALGSSQHATAGNSTCAAACTSVECNYTNCNSDAVEANSGLDLSQCKCTEIDPIFSWMPSCGAGTPSAIFCMKPPGNQDPPSLKSGMMTQMLSEPNQIDLDPTQSAADVTINFNDGFDFPHSDEEKFSVSGQVVLHGRCKAGEACDALLDMDLWPDDVTFHFSSVVCGLVPPCFQDIDAKASSITIVGGMGSVKVHIDANGNGQIPLNALSLHAEAVISGVPNQSAVRDIWDHPNDRPIDFTVDFANKTFSIPSSPFSFADGTGTLTLVGTITNQPPVPSAGAPQTVECSSPSGGPVTLAGSATDADNNIWGYEWWQGLALQTPAGSGASVVVSAPFTPPSLTTSYSLSVFDVRQVLGVAETSVTVQDTTPPTLDLSVTPDCLWPPNHRMVLYQLGNGLNAKATDPCDLNPTVQIVGVTSNQPALGGGSGNTATDVIFGKDAFCVRSERDGTLQTDREYTVSVEARDASGNVTTKQTIIDVHHSQSPIKCAAVDPSRIVDDNDPRCSGMLLFAGAGGLGRRRRRRKSRSAARAIAVALGVLGPILGILGCSTDTPNLQQQVQGWWVDPKSGPCSCPAQAECQAGDCMNLAVLGLLPDGRYYDGHVSYSAKAATMSTVGTLSTGTFRVSDGSVIITQAQIPDATMPVSFTPAGMLLGTRVEARPPQNVWTALDNAVLTGNAQWAGLSVPQ